MDVETVRRLIWVPIIHTPEDMGRLRASVRDRHIGRHGRAGWDQHVHAVGEFWREVRRRVDGLDVDPSTIRLYQDALPVCGFEEQIVRELAHAGGANHRLLADLMVRGAVLMGTESPHLLVEEYELNRRSLAGPPSPANRDQARKLLESRDQFIADRIAQTLRSGETGLLFLGMAHSVEGLLPADVQVDRLDLVASTP